MAKRTFEMNNKQYSSMMDIARDLGIKRVYPKDFEKYGIKEVVAGQETKVDVPAETKVEAPKAEKKQPAPEKSKKAESTKSTKEDKKVESKDDRRFTRKTGTEEQIKEVQGNVKSMTLVEFNGFIKHFTVEALEKMATEVGVNLWENISNQPIRRMRLLMELKNYYYPNEKIEVKPASCWKKIELQKLIDLATEKKLQFKVVTDEKIQRMSVVMALNNAGLTPDDIKEETANA